VIHVIFMDLVVCAWVIAAVVVVLLIEIVLQDVSCCCYIEVFNEFFSMRWIADII
jgi:hypothetical protein